MEKTSLLYKRPSIIDHGSLRDLTAALHEGGRQDGLVFSQHPTVIGHSCPAGAVAQDACNGNGGNS
ncbi:MAG TPA: hypothetical protein VFP23_01340 [Solirubrobacterales bacterium]|nr:hypothetical protein [Solirubrobacterales bacterium]